jgi:indole-3-glycerol phosphate synthase
MNFATILRECKADYKRFSKRVVMDRVPKNFRDAILEKKEAGLKAIISEIKPSSPLGPIREVSDPREIARQMISGGACGISVLTEKKFFGGGLENLKKVSEIASVPVLRKDFIFDEAQIYEAYHYGADSLLLISSFFEEELRDFIDRSRELGMEPLVEVHSLEDIRRAEKAGAEIYVINNRDKDTLKIDLNRSRLFSKHIKGTNISASGIEALEDLDFVLKYCDAALIGTAIMKAGDVKEKVKEFVYGS